jgi:hypothetical protein
VSVDDSIPERRRLADRRAERSAYERGVAAARLAARLDRMDEGHRRHEERLTAINGSVAKTAENLERLTRQIGEVATERQVRAVMKHELAEAESEAGALSLTRWQKWGILAVGLVGVGSLVLASLQAIGHG